MVHHGQIDGDYRQKNHPELPCFHRHLRSVEESGVVLGFIGPSPPLLFLVLRFFLGIVFPHLFFSAFVGGLILPARAVIFGIFVLCLLTATSFASQPECHQPPPRSADETGEPILIASSMTLTISSLVHVSWADSENRSASARRAPPFCTPH